MLPLTIHAKWEDFFILNLRKDFTEPEIQMFLKQCNFTKDERNVFMLCVRNLSRTYICNKLSMSESTVDRNIKNIKYKILKITSK